MARKRSMQGSISSGHPPGRRFRALPPRARKGYRSLIPQRPAGPVILTSSRGNGSRLGTGSAKRGRLAPEGATSSPVLGRRQHDSKSGLRLRQAAKSTTAACGAGCLQKKPKKFGSQRSAATRSRGANGIVTLQFGGAECASLQTYRPNITLSLSSGQLEGGICRATSRRTVPGAGTCCG